MSEPHFKKVDDGRVVVPHALCQAVSWISGTEKLSAWLVLIAFGRYRLLSHQDVEASADLRSLRDRIAAQAERGTSGVLDFEEDSDVMLPSRLVEAKLSLGDAGWRLTLPRTIVNLWGLRRGQNTVAVMLSGGYIEIWAMENLKSALSVPLDELF